MSTTAAPGASASYVVRFPQDAQSWDLVAGGLARAEELRSAARSAWQAWTPYAEKTSWTLSGSMGMLGKRMGKLGGLGKLGLPGF